MAGFDPDEATVTDHTHCIAKHAGARPNAALFVQVVRSSSIRSCAVRNRSEPVVSSGMCVVLSALILWADSEAIASASVDAADIDAAVPD